MAKSRSYTLYCFSPAVMLATFIIEMSLAAYTFFRRQGPIARLSIMLLVCLASFQLAEYQVCQGPVGSQLAWTKFGLVGITLLPALGVHIVALLTKRTPLVWVAYVFAALFAAAFLGVPNSAVAGYCLGNYVLITMPNQLIGNYYQWYYFAFILVGVAQLVWGIVNAKKSSHQIWEARIWMLIGYLSFTVPMAIVGQLKPEVQAGTPSIMCGFALLLAIILGLRVVPLTAEKAQ